MIEPQKIPAWIHSQQKIFPAFFLLCELPGPDLRWPHHATSVTACNLLSHPCWSVPALTQPMPPLTLTPLSAATLAWCLHLHCSSWAPVDSLALPYQRTLHQAVSRAPPLTADSSAEPSAPTIPGLARHCLQHI